VFPVEWSSIPFLIYIARQIPRWLPMFPTSDINVLYRSFPLNIIWLSNFLVTNRWHGLVTSISRQHKMVSSPLWADSSFTGFVEALSSNYWKELSPVKNHVSYKTYLVLVEPSCGTPSLANWIETLCKSMKQRTQAKPCPGPGSWSTVMCLCKVSGDGLCSNK
jgi:hypothetical protein